MTANVRKGEVMSIPDSAVGGWALRDSISIAFIRPKMAAHSWRRSMSFAAAAKRATGSGLYSPS